jgi:hypothetical protein
VRVQIHRRPNLTVAQNFHNNPWVDILSEQDAGAAMPQVVKPYLWQARCLERRLEMVEQIMRLNRGAVAGREHQIAIDPAIAERLPLGVLAQLMLPQCHNQRISERQQAPARFRLGRIAMELATVPMPRAAPRRTSSTMCSSRPSRSSHWRCWISCAIGVCHTPA